MGMNLRNSLGIKMLPFSLTNEPTNRVGGDGGGQHVVDNVLPTAKPAETSMFEGPTQMAEPMNPKAPVGRIEVQVMQTEVAEETDTVRAALMAQAEKLRSDMVPAEIADLTHPEIRAAALWGCNLVAHRNDPLLKTLVESVVEPVAGGYGPQVQELYTKALKAKSDKNREIFERERHKRSRKLNTSLTAQLLVGSILVKENEGQ